MYHSIFSLLPESLSSDAFTPVAPPPSRAHSVEHGFSQKHPLLLGAADCLRAD